MTRKAEFKLTNEDLLREGSVLSSFKRSLGRNGWAFEITSPEIPAHVLTEDGEWIDEQVYLVTEYKLGYLKERLAKLQKLSVKLDCDAPQAWTLGWAQREHHEIDAFGKAKRTVERRVLVAVAGAAPKLDQEWSFVATIEHSRDGTSGEWINMLCCHPGWEGGNLPKQYRTDAPTCDHCGQHRARKNTYVLHCEERGFVRVGSTCIKDFLGHVSPAHIASWATIVLEMLAGLDEESGSWGGGSGETHFGVLQFLSATFCEVESGGWMSRGQARDSFDGGAPTADLAWSHEELRSGLRQRGKREGPPPEVTDEHRDKAERALAWAREIDPDTDSDYLHNLRTVCMGGHVNSKHAGILASLYIAWSRAMEREVQRREFERAQAQSRHFAQAGDKIGRKLTANDKRNGKQQFPAMPVRLLMARTFEGHYGPTTLLKFVVSEGEHKGCVLQWFASGYHEHEADELGTVVATVKRNDEYQSIPQTVLTRAIFKKEEAA